MKQTKSISSEKRKVYAVEQKFNNKAFKIIMSVLKQNCRTEDISDKKSQEMLALFITAKLIEQKLLK